MLHSRDRRVAEAIKQTLSLLFEGEVQDPRCPDIVTITHVDVTQDLRQATVYYTQDPDDRQSRRRMEQMLEDSAGFLRSKVAEDVNIKFIPALCFRYDSSQKTAERIETILNQIKKDDEAKEDDAGNA